MKIKIPDTTKKQIKTNLLEGDYAAISIELCGDNSKRSTVMRNIASGIGDRDVVNAIVQYFKNKERALKKLTEKAQAE